MECYYCSHLHQNGFVLYHLKWFSFLKRLFAAKKVDSDSVIQVGIGDLSQHNIAAKMIDFRDNVAILELERRVDFANSACLGKPSLGTFIFTTISNDSKR